MNCLNRQLILSSVIVLVLVVLMSVTSTPSVAQAGNLTIVNVTDNRTDYGGMVPRYEKFEISFAVQTSAGNPYFPFNPSPPTGVNPNNPSYDGINVDAVFRDPDGTEYVQPAFYYQEFLYQTMSNWSGPKDWFYPTSNFSWKVRFSPHAPGQWQYKLVARDKTGSTETIWNSFAVANSQNQGFLKVSPIDPRYIEFDNGDYFLGLGYNENYRGIDWIDPVQDNRAKLMTMGSNGIQYVRIWLSQWNIQGVEWTTWSSHTGNAYLKRKHLVFDQVAPGSELSWRLHATLTPSSACVANEDGNSPNPAVKRNTNYRIQIFYKTEGIVGPRVATSPYGLVAKLGGWLWHDTDESQRCYWPGTGTLVTPHQNQNTAAWQVLEGTFNSGNIDFLDRLYIVLENVTEGVAYLDKVSVQEDLGGGQYGPNILLRPDNMDLHLRFDQRNSYAFDKLLELAKTNNVYLRPVLSEKNDWLFNSIDFTGNFTTTTSNDYFYGDYRNLTKTRWLLRAWWRYAQARWGYSTNIHSWELLNEGDPWSLRHYTLTDEFGQYMHCEVFGIPVVDGQKCNSDQPNDHLVSTSNWHSFPNTQFWSNNSYPNVDFADVHLYIPKNTDPTHFYDTALSTYDAGLAYGAQQPGGAGKPVIRGESGFTDNSSEPATTDLLADRSGIWLHNFVWGGVNPVGLYESGDWYPNVYMYNSSPAFDHRPHFGSYYRFIKNIPLNNGQYQDASASATDGNLRVWGQKDVTQGRAHLWIANKNHTWKNVVDGVPITPISDTVIIGGFTPNTDYPVEWWNTYSGAPISTQSLTTDANGDIALTLEDLTTDTAVKIGNYEGVLPTPSPSPIRCLPLGDIDCNGQVNALDASYIISMWGTNDFQADLDDSEQVGADDLKLLLTNYLL